MAELKKIFIKTDDGTCDAHVALPDTSGRYPGILFLMDAFGPREYLFGMIRRLADEGFIVLLPNLLYRIKPAPVISKTFPISKDELSEARTEVMALIQKYNYQDALKDMPSYLNSLSLQAGFNGKAGVTGYCMGGSLALRAAALFPEKIQAAASFHAGKLATTETDSPHLLLPQIKAEVYVAHADQDASMTDEQIRVFNDAFKDSNVNGRTEKYEGALHGFTMLDLPAGNPEATKKHWLHLLPLFRTLQS